MDTGYSTDPLVQAVMNGQDISELAAQLAETAQAEKFTLPGQSPEQPDEEQLRQPPAFELNVSANRMRAELSVVPSYPGQKVDPETVLDYLTQNRVSYGILEDEIRDYCNQGDFSFALTCAVGKQVLDEEDGRIEYHFDTEKVLRPALRDDGSLDFRELGLVKNISKGEVLCTLLPPEPGSDGMDIFSNVVQYNKGALPALPAGTNTQISEDGTTLISLADGSIELLPAAINVNEIYVVKGDVGRNSGNITANCSVLVQGDIKSSFFVKAGGDITVHGIVEHAQLEAGGNIVLSQGMNGGGKGSLKAGGNITGKFFENAILETKYDVYANIIMNSRVYAGGSLILNGAMATLAGGDCRVGRSIYARNIGNASGCVTRVQVESRELSNLLSEGSKKMQNPAVLSQQIKHAQQELQNFESNFELLRQQYFQKNPPDGGPSFQMILAAAEKKKEQYAKTLADLEAKKKETQQSLKSFLDFFVLARGMIFPGVKLGISSSTFPIVKEISCAKFHLGFDGIEWSPALPSDVPEGQKQQIKDNT